MTKNVAVKPTEAHPSSTLQISPSKMNNAASRKLNQILPTGPSLKLVNAKKQPRIVSFREAFGVLGIPMLGVLVGCSIWTFGLIFIALAPNEAANLAMSTSSFDNGQFWMITEENPPMALVGAVGLMIVAICYFLLILRMLFWREKLLATRSRRQTVTLFTSMETPRSCFDKFRVKYRRLRTFWNDIAAFDGRNRKRWTAFLKLVDLAMESAMLRQLYANGCPVSLTYVFACFIAMNSLSCVFSILTDRFSALTEIFIDSIFDIFSAVLFPIITLFYCHYTFDFDRRLYHTYLEVLPPGSFERSARTLAYPSEIALFRVNFDMLRIRSFLDFVIRLGMNLTFCYRFECVLSVLVWTRQRELNSRGVTKNESKQAAFVLQNSVPKIIALVFLAIGGFVLVYTYKAVSTSTSLCIKYPECVVYAYRWEKTATHCPCLSLIDTEVEPRTYDAWIHPVNAYNKVKDLAAPGLLTSLLIINRRLAEWPAELRTCRNLKTIQLIYTDIERVPDWASEFHNLELIHIEGKHGFPNLIELPQGLFSNMPRLSVIHLGIHENLKHLPPLSGVPNLQSLILAWTTQLLDLPSFDQVKKLQTLLLFFLLRLEWIPDMSPLKSLETFALLQPSPLCCNGFVGPCDLNQSSCQADALLETSATTCLMDEKDPNRAATPFLGNSGTEKLFNKFAPFVCGEMGSYKLPYLVYPTKEAVDSCNGIPYRRCTYPVGNMTGICISLRFEVLSCLPDGLFIALRRLQIKENVGPKCDPIEEKWLGC